MQAPVIMMSQNRQGEIDRREAAHDHEVNLKAELEIMQLHEKIEALKAIELARIVELLEPQSRLIESLLADRPPKRAEHQEPSGGSPTADKLPGEAGQSRCRRRRRVIAAQRLLHREVDRRRGKHADADEEQRVGRV